MNEQAELMRDSAREFAEKFLANIATDIERNGIDKNTLSLLVQQGFLGANLEESKGGSGLDKLSHSLLLFELSRVSPSIAANVFLHNDIALQIMGPEALNYVMSGKSIGFYFPSLMEGFTDSVNKSEFSNVIGTNPEKVIALDSDGKVYLHTGKASINGNKKPLGLRGIGSCNFISESKMEIGTAEQLEELLMRFSGDIASLFLGLSEGALNKALEYTKVRKTFNHALKDYEPVAFRMSELLSELEFMKFTLFSGGTDEIMDSMLKNQSASFSRKATKYALQFHGGYGYLEDFGVEKFYRDSVALNAMIYRPVKDKNILASKIYGEKSGYL